MGKKVGHKIYNVIRSILVTAILAVATVYVVLYLVLSIPSVQNKIREAGCEELSGLLGTDVSIEEVNITPFNQVVLHGVHVSGEKGDTILCADKVGVGFSMFNLLVRQRVVFTYAELIGLDGRLSRLDKNSPLNIQFIIDALSPKQSNTEPKRYDLNIRNVVIRRSRFSYDVLSADTLAMGNFDVNHIELADIRADISLPRIKNNDYLIELKRLSFKETKGFSVNNLAIEVEANDSVIGLSNIKIELPGSRIAFNDMRLHVNGLGKLRANAADIPIELSAEDNYVSLSDFKVFNPALGAFDFPIGFSFMIKGTLSRLEVQDFEVKTANRRLSVDLNGVVENIISPPSLALDLKKLNMSVNAAVMSDVVSNVTKVNSNVSRIIKNCGNISVNGSLKGGLSFANFSGIVATSVGDVKLNGIFSNQDGSISYAGSVSTETFNVGKLTGKENVVGSMACNIDVDMRKKGNYTYGKVDGNFSHIDIKGYRYDNITANVKLDRKTITGQVDVNDDNGALVMKGIALIDGENTAVDVMVDAKDVELHKLNLINKYPGKKLSFELDAFFAGNDFNNFTGNVLFRNFEYCDSSNNGVHISNFLVEADNNSVPKNIKVTSDIINGNISGQYDAYGLAQSIKKMLARPFPALFVTEKEDEGKRKGKKRGNKYNDDIPNNLYFNFLVDNMDDIAEMFGLPVKPLSPVALEGFITDSNHSLYLLVDAPYIQQKNKLIEGTRLQISLNDNLQVDAYSIIPLKKGKLALTVMANGINDRIDSNVSWTVDNKKSYSGELSASANVWKDTVTNIPEARIDINPSEIMFNDTAWLVHPARVDVARKHISVNDIYVTCEKQYIKINGVASDVPEDEITVELSDINLDYVFETLAIDNVTFGGRATGTFYASDLLSGIPRMYTEGLFVKALSYNDAVFGDAKILSSWINEDKCVTIKADVSQKNKLNTKIDGKIFIARDSLYFDFKPQRVNIAFLKPFMKTFSSDITGEASGHVVLYGTFKNIDLTGDVYADSLRMKLDYTNVYYTASDSVKMRPGVISMDGIELKDQMGNTAYLTGKVTHNYFHDATFDFRLTDARNLLCFDVNQKMNPDWYGRIFCNGSAFIEGRPGYVNIDVNMETAAGSSFTFVLSDTKVATEYDFITFVDRNKVGKDDDEENDARPERVKEFLKSQKKSESGNPSQFNINLLIEATPQAQMNLIMDPSGGDKIRATGNGNLRIGYNSADEEMTMFGTYTLARGNYNFTLQDIIIKDFTIREGSSLTFNGNPLSAVMDIEAIYSLHANLAELDESFATDGELNRTNVPVNALLRLQGDISAPEISFGLEFPTLTSDVYRKVMSIVSTEDMMNRQIIYLLALNSFYTPDYMADNNRSNELASVASSTISSQLSNLLGQMSENWSISPNLRSENGDFSDIEVELALSSQLLNNRLLFNGNFGYRDNAMNTRNSNFIGDFDIEYLLTKNGNIRLKAYNHYNDQNYYVRSALTTQGVGVVFKHDFDNIYDFLWRKKPQRKSENKEPADTVAKHVNDDILEREPVVPVE